MEFSVRRPSPLNTYSYVREENLGSTRKLVQNYLLITCISKIILAIHTQSVNGLKELSKENFLQPTCSGCLVPTVARVHFLNQKALVCMLITICAQLPNAFGDAICVSTVKVSLEKTFIIAKTC